MKRFIIFTMLFFCIFLFSLLITQANESIPTVLERVVMIISMDENYQPISIGSGFVIGKNGVMHTIVISYRESEKDIWADDLGRVINTFKFEKR